MVYKLIQIYNFIKVTMSLYIVYAVKKDVIFTILLNVAFLKE
jgi:hypothetical protein